LKVAAALAASGLTAGRLELEITEAVLIRDDDAALAILHQLRAIGVRISLNDFGTGYSSLSYLRVFRSTRSRSTAASSPISSGATDRLRSYRPWANIAAARNMTTTAEGVETKAQCELLRALGCTEMQGYLFIAAKPAEDVRKLLLPHDNRNVAAA